MHRRNLRSQLLLRDFRRNVARPPPPLPEQLQAGCVLLTATSVTDAGIAPCPRAGGGDLLAHPLDILGNRHDKAQHRAKAPGASFFRAMREEFVGMLGGANAPPLRSARRPPAPDQAGWLPTDQGMPCRRPGSRRIKPVGRAEMSRAPPRPLLRPPDSVADQCSDRFRPECPPGVSHRSASCARTVCAADALHRPAPSRVRHRDHAAHRVVEAGSACSRRNASTARCRRGRSSWRRLSPASADRGTGASAITTSALWTCHTLHARGFIDAERCIHALVVAAHGLRVIADVAAQIQRSERASADAALARKNSVRQRVPHLKLIINQPILRNSLQAHLRLLTRLYA